MAAAAGRIGFAVPTNRNNATTLARQTAAATAHFAPRPKRNPRTAATGRRRTHAVGVRNRRSARRYNRLRLPGIDGRDHSIAESRHRLDVRGLLGVVAEQPSKHRDRLVHGIRTHRRPRARHG